MSFCLGGDAGSYHRYYYSSGTSTVAANTKEMMCAYPTGTWTRQKKRRTGFMIEVENNVVARYVLDLQDICGIGYPFFIETSNSSGHRGT